ncbi:uncharacterized protein LTR77_003648 [Saxophila tyrrhenica]|uniref:Uncharacterized protein n=1 Tax=Saxophila tyrrhenica TaxID=1690608 RepID=A0AAV9PEE9_9PEZI|nr:hypothetical protein LTR77_003648 [Saxophila tyrrhenica]
MSDGRKDMKAQEKMTPESSKSTTDKVKEGATNLGDTVQRDAVPDSEKSTGQSMSDKASREKDSAKGESTMDKVKGSIGMNK